MEKNQQTTTNPTEKRKNSIRFGLLLDCKFHFFFFFSVFGKQFLLNANLNYVNHMGNCFMYFFGFHFRFLPFLRFFSFLVFFNQIQLNLIHFHRIYCLKLNKYYCLCSSTIFHSLTIGKYHCCSTFLSLVCRRRLRRFLFNFFLFVCIIMCVKNCFQNFKKQGKTKFSDTFFSYFYGNATDSLSHNQMKT